MSPPPGSTLEDPKHIIAELRRERDEALAREAALAEVLQVINSSPGDLQPVLDAILEGTLRVCEAAFGFIATYDGEHFHLMAERGLPPAFAEILQSFLTGLKPADRAGAPRRARPARYGRKSLERRGGWKKLAVDGVPAKPPVPEAMMR